MEEGRGTLGVLAPLIRSWAATADSPMGKVRCTRAFRPILGGSYIQLVARWEFAKGAYEELAVFGVGDQQVQPRYRARGRRRVWRPAGVLDFHHPAELMRQRYRCWRGADTVFPTIDSPPLA